MISRGLDFVQVYMYQLTSNLYFYLYRGMDKFTWISSHGFVCLEAIEENRQMFSDAALDLAT